MRYIATKYGALAHKVEEQAMCDAYAEQIQDFIMNVRPWIWTVTRNLPDKDEKYNTVLLPALQETFVPIFERQLETNKSGWLVSDSCTWVDFLLADITDKLIKQLNPESVSILGDLIKHHKRVFAFPQLKERIKQREKYIF